MDVRYLKRVGFLTLLLLFLPVMNVMIILDGSSYGSHAGLARIGTGADPDVFIDPDLKSALQDMDPSEQIDVWFLFKNKMALDSWLASHDSLNYRAFGFYPAIYCSATAGEISMILDDVYSRLIKSAWLEHEIDTRGDSRELGMPRSSAVVDSQSNLSAAIQLPNLTAFRQEKGLNGRGVIVGILSTGIDGTHADLKYIYNETGDSMAPKIIANVSFVDWDPLFVDIHGEGTFIAGIVAGTGNASAGKYTGVAPGAQLINAKCVDALGITLWFWAVSALEYSFTHGADIIVIGWSLVGFPGDPLTTAVNELTRRGVTVVAAAGDIGQEYMTINTPGMAAGAITVGAMNTTNPSSVSIPRFSSRGPTLEMLSKPDLLAPGVDIISCLPDLNFSSYSSYVDLPLNITPSFGERLESNGNYTRFSSTGAAAAYVGGACALLLQEYMYARPETLKDALIRTAMTLGGGSNVQGSGAIDIESAWNYLNEHGSRIPVARSSSPPLPYMGFVPNYEVNEKAENITSLWFVSSYGSVNFFNHMIQSLAPIPGDRNHTDLLQGMFGIAHDGEDLSFFIMDTVYREMHLTHYGSYSRAVSVLNHQDKLIIVITAETWQESLNTMRLRFDMINIADGPIKNLTLGTWFKVDLDFAGEDLEALGNNDTVSFNATNDMMVVKGPYNASQPQDFFLFTASNSSAAHATGDLNETILWVQDHADFTNNSFDAGDDPVDNATFALKYNISQALMPGEYVSINFSMGCGVNFTDLLNKTIQTISTYEEPPIRDISVIKFTSDRMYETSNVITSSCIIMNLGNTVVEDVMVVFGVQRTLNESSVLHDELWEAGDVDPMKVLAYNTSWVPVHESMYSLYWASADKETLQYMLYNIGPLLEQGVEFPDIDFSNFDPNEYNWSELLENNSVNDFFMNGSLEVNPLDNIYMRDIFIYNEDKMYIHENVIDNDDGKPVPRPYAGITPQDPNSAPTRPEFIGDYGIVNFTVYSAVPLTGFTCNVSGNASITFITDLENLSNISSIQNGTLPANVNQYASFLVFIDATLMNFPMAGNYISILNFTSDQGYIDTIIINFTIRFPRGKVLFDIAHNDLLDIFHGDQRDMIMGGYYQLYEALKAEDFDVDEFLGFSSFSEMKMENVSLVDLYDAIIIADPEYQFSQDDLVLLMDFFDRGGKIIVLGNTWGNYTGKQGGLGGDQNATSDALESSTRFVSGLDLSSLDLDFNFNLTSLRILLAGGTVIPDTCNIAALNSLVNMFGFNFSDTVNLSTTTVSTFNQDHDITKDLAGFNLHLHSYSYLTMTGNLSSNDVLVNDSAGNIVAAIHEDNETGGKIVVVGDSNMFAANYIEEGSNAEFIQNIVGYVLENQLQVEVEMSKPEIHMGESLFLQCHLTAQDPDTDVTNVTGFIAFVNMEFKEKVMMQFFPTRDGYYATFLYSNGFPDPFNESNYLLPPLNHTGDYYAVIYFNDPNVTGSFIQLFFTILPPAPEEQTKFEEPARQVLIEGVAIFSISMGLIVTVYFNQRRKQEESMSIPELDEKMIRDLDNVFMEMQSRIKVISEEILYGKYDDYKTRIKNIENKIAIFKKSLNKLQKLKKKMSKY
ncbi:MAG: S8 family serine peptidase [Promethearchaeota archaeon]